MVTRESARRALLGRDVAIAYAAIVALYLVRHVRFQPLQIPAYLLIVAYDVVEVALPVVTPYHPIGFPVFLYLLAVGGAAAARRAGERDGPAWTRTLGGVCLVVGVLSLLFASWVGGPLVAPTDNPTPLAITGATALVFLGAGGLLLRYRSRDPSGGA